MKPSRHATRANPAPTPGWKTDTFQTIQARKQSGSLHKLLSQSPLNRIRLGGDGVLSPVREVEL